ncbi:MAG: xanthine dehydrogenase family protein molybdopterin-binding subunit [Chthoniobacterales bacterium]
MNESVLGKAQDRIDGRLKVTGRASYSADPIIENIAYGYLIQSTIARGRIRSIDVTAAEGSPGVLAIFTPFNSLKLYDPVGRQEGGNPGELIPPLQSNEVLYYGQTIGLVVAESFEEARDAARLIGVEYEKRPPVLGLEANLDKAYAPDRIQDEGSTVAILASGVPGIDDALAKSEARIEARYTQPVQHHNPMEPHATIASWDGDRLTLYDTTQYLDGHRRSIASALGIDEDKVRVLCPFVGGAFGCKGSMWMHSPLTAAAARTLNRPVKTVLARDQMYTSVGHRPALIQTVSLGASQDGTLQAVKHDVLSTVSASRVFIESAAHRTSRVLYKSPNIQVSQKLVPLDVAPPTFMRAPGVAPGMYALECAMDELAVKLRMDPIALRMKSYAEIFPGRNVPWSSKHLKECYEVGAEKFGWSQRNPVPRSNRTGDWLNGHGIATALYPAHRSRAAAKVRLQADGSAVVSSATHDLGTGMYTVMAMVGADSLGLPVERVHAQLGDSALPPAPASGGSQTTASVTPAIRAAADSVKKKLILTAVKEKQSPFYGMKPEELLYEGGRIVGNGKSADFGDLLSGLGRGAVEATESAQAGEEEQKYAFHSFGAQFCEVRVNEWTGETRVSRFTSVIDIGKVVSLKTARSQVMGGVIFGLGMALLESTHFDEQTGRVANANIADYLLATNSDAPFIDVRFIDKPDTIFNSIGARGVGEIGITGVAAAVANAIFNATGKRVRDLPITPEKILSPDASEQEKISVIGI